MDLDFCDCFGRQKLFFFITKEICHFVISVDVSKLSEQGEDTLLDTKQKVHVLSEKTAQELKKNVYKNYTQFIETAREISNILSYLL